MYRPWEEITHFGGFLFFVAMAVLAWSLGSTQFALQLFVGIVFTLALTALIRLVYYTPRPNKEKYTNLFQKLESSSFPSLHAMRAWMLAVLLHEHFGFLLGLAGVAVAILVSVSRFVLKKHYARDLIAGGIIGVIAGVCLLLL